MMIENTQNLKEFYKQFELMKGFISATKKWLPRTH